MAVLGQCERPECRRAATQAVRTADMVRTVHCCTEHASDFRPCDAEGCERLAQVVIAIGGRRAGRRLREEVWLLRGMRRALSASAERHEQRSAARQ